MIKLRPGAPPDCVRIRPPLFHPDFPLILFWSQKSGCTTVVKWFFAQLGLLDEALAHSPWIHNYEQEVFKKRPGYRRHVAAALRSGDYTAVKIVRDPWRRAPSAFLILAERGALRKRKHWVQAHWEMVDEWLVKQGRDPAAGLSFMDHLALVRETEAAETHSINLHLSQQFVAGEEEFLSQRVPIEEFRDWATAKAASMAGVRAIDFDLIADSKHHHTVDEAVTASLGETPETVPIARGAYANGRFPSGSAFVNARTREAIAATYAADFKAYGDLYPTTP